MKSEKYHHESILYANYQWRLFGMDGAFSLYNPKKVFKIKSTIGMVLEVFKGKYY